MGWLLYCDTSFDARLLRHRPPSSPLLLQQQLSIIGANQLLGELEQREQREQRAGCISTYRGNQPPCAHHIPSHALPVLIVLQENPGPSYFPLLLWTLSEMSCEHSVSVQLQGGGGGGGGGSGLRCWTQTCSRVSLSPLVSLLLSLAVIYTGASPQHGWCQ